MGSLILNLTNQANWLLVYSESREVTQRTSISYVPLPPLEIPFIFDRRILVFRTFSATAKPYWRYGGILTQRYQVGSGGAASTLPIADFTRRKLRLNREELIIFPPYTPDYQLLYEAPYWVEDLTVEIYEYLGTEADSTEQLIDQARADILRVEAKVDALAQSP